MKTCMLWKHVGRQGWELAVAKTLERLCGKFWTIKRKAGLVCHLLAPTRGPHTDEEYVSAVFDENRTISYGEQIKWNQIFGTPQKHSQSQTHLICLSKSGQMVLTDTGTLFCCLVWFVLLCCGLLCSVLFCLFYLAVCFMYINLFAICWCICSFWGSILCGFGSFDIVLVVLLASVLFVQGSQSHGTPPQHFFCFRPLQFLSRSTTCPSQSTDCAKWGEIWSALMKGPKPHLLKNVGPCCQRSERSEVVFFNAHWLIGFVWFCSRCPFVGCPDGLFVSLVATACSPFVPYISQS